MSITIVCTIDDNYAQHCAVMLSSLFQNNQKTNFSIYIITDKLSLSNQRKLNKFLSASKQNFQIIHIDKSLLQNAPVTHHISLATYFRLFITEVIPADIEKVLFVDSDIIVRKSIDELWQTNIQNFSHAATISAGMDDYATVIGLPKDSLYFNAGLMLINLEAWRNLKVFERGCELISQQPDRLQWWDQDVLNILLHNYWLPINLKWNSQPFIYDEEGLGKSPYQAKYEKFKYLEAQLDPAIVHFVGGGNAKPWYYDCQHPFRSEYTKYLATTPWKNTKLIGTPNPVKQLTSNLRFRLGLGSKIRNLFSPITSRIG